MRYFAGFDVSLEETAIGIVDETGRLVREGKVATEPEALDAYMRAGGLPIDRVGLEAGPLSTWLHGELTAGGWTMVCIETRRLRAVTRAMPVKSDRKDAEAIAQAMRTSWYRAVHVKSAESQRIRVLLRNRKILQAKRLDIDNEIRGTLKAFGLKLGKVGRAGRPRPRARRRRGGARGHHAAHAAGPQRAHRRLRQAASPSPRDRSPGPGLPSAHDRTGHRRRDRARLQDGGRRPAPLPTFRRCRPAFRADATPLSIGRDRL